MEPSQDSCILVSVREKPKAATNRYLDDDEFSLSDAEGYFDEAVKYAFAGTSSSPLLHLPPELLTLIVERVLDACHVNSDGIRITNPSLKILRAVHPQIARLRL